MSPPAAQLLFELCFVCIRPILTNLSSIEQFCPLNRALKSAKLGGNSIVDEGTTALSEALKSKSILEELELPGNGISVAGAQSLANMLQFNRALTSLDLSFNKVGAGGAKAIADSLPQS